MSMIKSATIVAALALAGAAHAQDAQNRSYSHCYQKDGAYICDGSIGMDGRYDHSVCDSNGCTDWTDNRASVTRSEEIANDHPGNGRGGFETDAEYFARTGFHYCDPRRGCK